MAGIKPPDLEVSLGLSVYASHAPGIGGSLKRSPEDFVVEEVTPEGLLAGIDSALPCDATPGGFTHFTLVKKNWDTMRAAKEIARSLGVSQNRLSYAGTKDKHAVTAQRVSAANVPPGELSAIRLKDLTLKDFSYADEPVKLGSLWGNQFTITVRDVALEEDDVRCGIKKTLGELSGGFPNFFGLQRFGIARPITHRVGKKFLLGDFEGAFYTYLTDASPLEDEKAREARQRLLETRDVKAALREFPKNLGYELALLNHVVERPGDFRGAFRRLPRNLTSMFVHAFQSYVFNRALSECIMEGYVVERLPLVGYGSTVDEVSAKILAEEGIALEDFRVKEYALAGSEGSFRDCFVPVHDFKVCAVSADDANPRRRKATVSFKLPKGSYATVLLREFMKNQYW